MVAIFQRSARHADEPFLPLSSAVMKRIFCLLRIPFLTTSLIAAAADWPVSAQTDSSTVALGGISLTLADGLRIDKVASDPLTKWPIVADWDHQGRLVIAESAGVGRPIQQDNQHLRHRIVRLVDTDGDGRFDERIVAAESLAFPEGVLCLGNQIFVSAPPQIWRFIDEDDDGFCEQREIWFDGSTLTNCANDLHGPFLGPDGWIYWTKGAFGEQTHQLLDGTTLQTKASHIFRRHPEGGPIELVITGGMDNPVEVAFVPEGEKFFSSTFLQHPGDGLRDGLAHAVYGGLFGKPHSVIDGHPSTGGLMPIMSQLGPAAPSGLTCLHSTKLLLPPAAKRRSSDVPSPPTRTLVAALFNHHKLTAHTLVADGSTYRTIDSVIVSTDQIDFHPTDVLEDGDGSLLLIDTGGWYDLCCPTSRIDQKVASGGIYRITSQRTANSLIDRSPIDWLRIDTADAIEWLSDPRPWVRREANRRIKSTPDESLRALVPLLEAPAASIDDRLRALWALCQLGSDEALTAISRQLASSQPPVVRAACHAVSIHRSSRARKPLEQLLEHRDLAVRRAAAEALGRVGNGETMAKLLRASGEADIDRHLEHSLLYALIELSPRHASTDLLRLANNDRTLGAALLALDQSGRSESIDSTRLFEMLRSPDERLSATATAILAKHPERAEEATVQMQDLRLRAEGGDANAKESLGAILAGWSSEPTTQRAVQHWLSDMPAQSREAQQGLAERISQIAPQSALPPSWVAPLARWLEACEPLVRRILCEQLATLKLAPESADPLVQTLVDLARSADVPADKLRLLSALPLGTAIKDQSLEAMIVQTFLSTDVSLTPLASLTLARLKLSRDPVMALAESVYRVPPRYLAIAIQAVHRSDDSAAKEAVLARLADAPSAKSLPQNFLSELFRRDAPLLRQQADEVESRLLRPSADVQVTVERMLKRLGPGDPARGLQTFRGEKAQCSACHRIGYIGHDVGPVLTNIGASRTEESLLESILFPSARQEQSYQATRVLTADGRVYSGLVSDPSAQSFEIRLDAERRIKLDQDEVERMDPSDVSIMPGGIADVLTIEELSDLMALLRAAK